VGNEFSPLEIEPNLPPTHLLLDHRGRKTRKSLQ
jgi:hypothetical protein